VKIVNQKPSIMPKSEKRYFNFNSARQPARGVTHVPLDTRIATAVEDYPIENPSVSGLTIEQIKADTDIADSLTKKHASMSDNQDLSGKMDVTAFSGLAKITVGITAPSTPSAGDLWIDTNN
jgi:hypothetical protein